MRADTRSAATQRRYRGAGLTQTVTSVGAIVALAIAVFIPALIGLRDRHREAICTARIGLLTRAMLVYAEDFDETPPFMGLGWENIHYPDRPSHQPLPPEAPNELQAKSRWGWAVAETWHSQSPELLWNGLDDPPQHAMTDADLRTGLLFPYARHENVYRCPEFERVPDKSQTVFNYARTVLGRKWIMGPIAEGGSEPDYWSYSNFGAPGPIMRISEIHRPTVLTMLHDEWWLRHVGSSYDEHVPPRGTNISGGWMAVDCMHYLLSDEIGRYHGRPEISRLLRRGVMVDLEAVKQGTVGCYDGHVELARTFWADMSDATDGDILNAAWDIVRFLNEQTFAQRGKMIAWGLK